MAQRKLSSIIPGEKMTAKDSNFLRVTITIRKDQKTWVDKHPSINLSGLLQEMLQEMIDKKIKEG
jgi:hypothetical protein